MKKAVDLCLKLETIGYLLAVGMVLPLFYTKGYEQIGIDKVELFQMICKVSFVAILPLFMLAVVLHWKEWTYTKMDCLVLLFGGSVCLSFLSSDYRMSVAWGYEGWGLGALPLLTMVLSYFLVSRYFDFEKQVGICILTIMIVISLLGILNRFMIDPLGIQKMLYASEIPYWEKANYLSTIGNINWFSGFLCIPVFVLIGLFLWQDGKSVACKGILVASVFLGMQIFVLQGSNTGHLTLFVLGVVLYILCAENDTWMHRLWILGVMLFTGLSLSFVWIHLGGRFNYKDELLHLLVNSYVPWCGLLVCVLTSLWISAIRKKGTYSSLGMRRSVVVVKYIIGVLILAYGVLSILETKGWIELEFLPTEWFVWDAHWGVDRGINLWAGFAAFDAQSFLHKLFGVGPDGMVQYLYSSTNVYIAGRVREIQGELLLTNAHCEPLTMLVNQGLFGLLTYVSLLLFAIKYFLEDKEPEVKALGLGILAYVIHNLFSFGTILSMSLLFICLGIGRQKKQ